MIFFGGEEPASGKSTNQVWILKNANGTGGPPSWTAVYAFGPPPRQNHQAVYDAATNRMIIVGGLSYLGGTPTPLGDAWVLTNANGSESTSPQWILLTPSGAAPSPRHGFAAAWNPFSNALTIFGGCTDSSFVCATDSDELWTLSNASGKDISGNTVTPAWTKLAYSGTAPSAHSQFGSTAYDLWNNQLFLFGGRVGQGAPFGSFTNMTWVLKNVNGLTGQAQWNTLTPGRSPAARGQSVPPNLFDAVGDHFIVFGGPGLNDTWTLRTSAGQN
jgi:hypothetical protein